MKKIFIFMLLMGFLVSLPSLAVVETMEYDETEVTDSPEVQAEYIAIEDAPMQEEIRLDLLNKDDESDIPDINKNILAPNVSPGIMTDTQRAREYYESFEGAHRTELENKPDKEELIEDEELKLPARVQENGLTVHIDKVVFTKSEIFSDEEINKFKALAENKDLTAEDLNNLIDIINSQYAKRNVLTARAFLNEGSIKDGVLEIELMEAKIGNIYVEGNRFNRKWFLRSRLREKPGDVLDLGKMEEDLRRFNKNARSIRLSAKLKPGEQYGTTDVILQAEEKLPYHFSTSWDSFGRETTGLLRSGFMVSADSLAGFQDRLTGAVNIARSSTNPFIDYNFPINRKGTRVGASYMYGNNKVTSGEYQDFKLGANTHVLSAYVTHPLFESQKGSLNLNVSGNAKFSKADIAKYVYSDFNDYNVAVGLGGQRNFKKSVLYGSIYSTNGIIEDDMRHTSDYFTKVNADAYYIHYLPKNIIGILRAGGQYSPHNIAYVEQYQIGGMSSVRGYTESLLLGASSYFVSAEMLFPIPFLPQEVTVPFSKGEFKFRLRDCFKLAAFIDNGAIFPHEGRAMETPHFLTSVGAGIRMAFSKYFTARLYLGIPLMNRGLYEQSSARVHFDLVASPF